MRIVSLCPSLTELVFALGRGADLVGVTEWCVHPAEGVARVEKVGGTKTPDVRRIVELAPDLVLMNEEENRREDAELLREAGIRCHVSMPRDAAETAAMVRSIADSIGSPEAGASVAADIERRIVEARLRADGKPRVRFAYLIWRKPFMAVNGDTYASALLELSGGENVFARHAQRYPEISAQELAAAAPDAVLLCTEPFPFQEHHADELAALTGLARHRFEIVDGEYLSWHGSRTPAGIEYALSRIEAARSGVSAA
ncbi:MAG: ABC transporter substrate-binding protein [Planctomycetes bacterium]|nr:ABC transporter substrate-binding protein [Planctomycetota bacterium]